MQIKPVHLLLAGVGGVALYALFHKTPRFKGDVAERGDQVHVPVTSLPPGALPAAIPAGAGFVSVRVDQTAEDTLSGPITAFVIQESPVMQQIAIPTPIGPVLLPRSLVTTVVRGGKVIA